MMEFASLIAAFILVIFFVDSPEMAVVAPGKVVAAATVGRQRPDRILGNPLPLSV
jgi:hypothetical protein